MKNIYCKFITSNWQDAPLYSKNNLYVGINNSYILTELRKKIKHTMDIYFDQQYILINYANIIGFLRMKLIVITRLIYISELKHTQKKNENLLYDFLKIINKPIMSTNYEKKSQNHD